jgi:hypothetical protein
MPYSKAKFKSSGNEASPCCRPFWTHCNIRFIWSNFSLVRSSWSTTPLRLSWNYSFNIFVAALYVWRPSPLYVTWRRAMSWWQGTDLKRTFVRNAPNRTDDSVTSYEHFGQTTGVKLGLYTTRIKLQKLGLIKNKITLWKPLPTADQSLNV